MSDDQSAPSLETVFQTVLNVVLIAIGIMSALALARDGFGVSFNDFLEGVIQAYDDLAKEVALAFFEPALQLVLAKLRTWWSLDVQLYPHWKYLFVLLWLLFGKTAAIPQQRSLRVFAYVWGLVCALFGALVDGAVPLSDGAVGFGVTAACALFAAGLIALLLRRVTSPFGLRAWFIGMSFLLFVAIYNALMAWRILPIPFIPLPPPGGLVLAANFVAMIAFFLLLLGPWGDDERPWTSWLFRRQTQAGLNILAVYGGAALIVWLGHAPG